jgi:hypothetical protein
MSGWLIFKGLGGDYAGLGGTNFYLAKKLLEHYKDYIDLREIEVHEGLFENFLKIKHFDEDFPNFDEDGFEEIEKENSIIKFSEEYKKIISLYKEFSCTTLAQLLELLVYYYFVKKFGVDSVKWSFQPDKNSNEIDILAIDKNNKKIFLVECSLQIELPQTEIEKFNKKKEKITTMPDYKGYSVEPWYVTTKKAFASQTIDQFKTAYKNQGIEIIEFEQKLLTEIKLLSPEVSADKFAKLTKLFERFSNKTDLVRLAK